MKDILFIAKRDLFYMLRQRETLLWMFVMPIGFFYFIGNVTGNFSSTGSGEDPIAVRSGENAGFLFGELISRLEERDYVVVQPETEEGFQTWKRRLTVPTGFTDSVLAGSELSVEFRYDEEDMTNDYHKLRVGQAVYSLLADIVVSDQSGAGSSPESFAELNSQTPTLTMNVISAGERKKIPSGFEQAIPGIMVMFIVIVMGTSGAILLVIERNQGLLRRLAYSPISRGSIITGKWGARLAIGIVQIVFAMLAGTVLFGMEWGPNLPMVLVIMIAYGALFGALGLLLGSIARNEKQAAGIGVLSANVLAALGGCWWPIEIAPSWMQKLQLFLPTGWAMDAMHKLVNFGAPPSSVLPHLAAMIVTSLILGWLASRLFRFS